MLKRSLVLALLFVACSPAPTSAPDAGAGVTSGSAAAGSTGGGSTGHGTTGSIGGGSSSGGTSSGGASTGGGSSGGNSSSSGGSTGSATAATVLVHYDVGFGHRITLRGSGAGLDWNTGVDATWTQGNVWTLTLSVPGEIELKPLVDDDSNRWAIGPNWHLAPGQTLDIWPFFDHTAGAVSKWGDWQSAALGNSREVWVYLPPSYDENSAERYPVVYMHDGQNLFYDSSSFSGVSWNVQGAMDQGANDGTIHEAIVVGIGNTGARMDEYTPVADPQYGGGNGDTYLQAIITDLKPQIDASLRTFPDRQHTAIVGSSLGGLISVFAGDRHADTFALVGALSPSTWWDNTWIIQTTAGTAGAAVKPDRVYLDSGDSGNSNDDVTNTAQLAQTYRSLGIPLDYVVQPGAEHGEYWWRQRIGGGLGFLLGPR